MPERRDNIREDIETWKRSNPLRDDEHCDHCGALPARLQELTKHPSFIPGTSYDGVGQWYCCDACVDRGEPATTYELLKRHCSEAVANWWRDR